MGPLDSPRAVVRTLLRNPGFSLPAFLILALGIGAVVAIFTVVDGVLLEPLDLPDSQRLVTMCERHASLGDWCGASVPTVKELGDAASSVEVAGTARWWPFTISDAAGTEAVTGAIATPEFFRTLRVSPPVGRLFAPDEVGPDGDDVVLLSHGLWTRRYGADPDVPGRTLTVDGESTTIVGVLPRGFEFPGLEATEVWRPVHVPQTGSESRDWRGFLTVARLADGVSPERARTELAGLYRSMGEEYDAVTADWRLDLMTLREKVVGGVSSILLAFLGAVALLLLIACANVANLVVARAARQRHEFAVRVALGARREHLAGRVVAESLVLALGAGAAGLLLAWWGSRVFVALAPAGVPRLDNVHLDVTVAVFALAVSLGTVAVFGLLPVLRTRDLEVSEQLTSAARRGGDGASGRHLRRVLVVTELALSLVLLFWAALLARSLAGFLDWDPGFETDGLVVASAIVSQGTHPTREDKIAFFRHARDELAALPGVTSVGRATVVPLRGGREHSTVRYQGAEDLPPEARPSAAYFSVGPSYFETLGLPLLEGRGIHPSDGPDAPPVAVVNRTLSERFWPGGEAVGKWVEFDFGDAEPLRFRVVGVSADVQPVTPGEAPEPEVYWSDLQMVRGGVMFVVRTRSGSGDQAASGASASIAASVRERLEGLAPGLTLGPVLTLDELLEEPLAVPRFNLVLVGVFAVVAAALAATGVYGLLAYLVARRSRAIGIRMAMGSSTRRVVRDVVLEGSGLAGIGVLLGALVALLSAPLVADMVHGVSSTDPVSLGATSAGLAVLAVISCGVPALRAARVNPADLLREE